MLPKSPSETRLQWEAPASLPGTLDVYKVKVCNIPDTKYCVVITARARCGRNLKTGLPATQEIQTPLFALPDVSNLAVIGVNSGYVTLSWQRPRGRFDYYSVEVTEHTASSTKATQKRQGLCANGTIVHPDQTELTCGPFEPCSNLSSTVRTLFNGPPQRMSPGVTVTGIFIPVEDQAPPTNITMFPESSSRTRLQWSQPEKTFGALEAYTRPKGRFDYYSIEVIEHARRSRSQHTVSLCANGTIIRPDQTKLTCGRFEPCTKLSYTMRTHLNGPPERASPGVTVNDVFIPSEELHPPRNITMVPTSTLRTQLHWDYADKLAAVILSHNVNICRTFRTCGRTENLSNCTEYVTSETSITFDSTEDTAYCVLVTAKARCGMKEINSRTAVAEIRTPIIVLPDVTTLRLVSVGANSFTAAWTKPKVNFDYYWIEVNGVNNDGTRVTPGTVGSCANGSIIHPDQTQVTCSQLQPCSKVNFKVRTHINGPTCPHLLWCLSIRHLNSRFRELILDFGSMKIALLLWIVGCHIGPLLVYTTEDVNFSGAKLTPQPDQSTSAPAKLGYSHRVTEGTSHASDGLSSETAGALNRVSRAVHAFGDASGSVDEYGVLRAVLNPPRQHGFLHFRRKRALSAPYPGIKRNVQDARSLEAVEMPITEVFKPLNQQAELPDSYLLVLTSKTKRSPNYVMHFGKRLETASAVGESDELKRASHDSIMYFGKRTNEQEVTATLENVYSTMNGGSVKRGANGVMYFGKRHPKYGVSTSLEGEPELGFMSADKNAPDRILRFGKMPGYSSSIGEVDAYVEEAEMKKRGNHIMYSGKQENEYFSGMTLSSMDDASSNAVKRFASASSKYSGRLDQLKSFSDIGRELHRVFQELKKRNRVLHFGKREPQPLSGHYYQQKRHGDRIIHFGEEAGYPFYADGAALAAAAMRDKKLKHSIIHFGKRDDDIVMGADKRNRIMRFGKQIGNDDQKYQFGQQLPMEKSLGNRILHLAKRRQATHLQSPNAWDYGTDRATETSRAGASKRAHQILHFEKRDGGANYDDIGVGSYPLVLAQDFDDADTSLVSGGHDQRETQKVIRKKRSTTPAESSDCIDDTVAQMMSSMEQITMVVPEVQNLTLIDVGPDYFTVSWTQPAVTFDYYWVEVQYSSDESDMLTPHRVGSCANGTVVHRTQTQITCDKFKACANVSVTVHAQVETASHLTFPGTTLRDLPEVTKLAVTDMDKDSITVSWQRPRGCFDNYIVEVAEEKQGRSGVGGLSAGSCAGGITVDANQSSFTCGKIEACSVRATVRTHRRGPLELTSSGVTVHDIIMSEKDMPEVVPTLATYTDTFVLRWNRPSGCFDKYILEVTYHETTLPGSRRGGSFCAGTTILDPDLTTVTCGVIRACANASVVLRTRRNGPHGRTSRGEALYHFFYGPRK
ncbi:hypothetical protein MTO96_007675 [Rhipicephalus appendiculatus]